MRLFLAALCFSSLLPAQLDPDYGQGWLPEFNLAAKRTLLLGEATPAEKYAWRPAPGVRSTSEVLMHVVETNFWLLGQAGAPQPLPLPVPKAGAEKGVTRKEDAIVWLKASFDAVRKSYSTADRQKKVKFFNRDATAEGVFLRVLVHNHEHMGQLIGYARMSGVKPPWSK